MHCSRFSVYVYVRYIPNEVDGPAQHRSEGQGRQVPGGLGAELERSGLCSGAVSIDYSTGNRHGYRLCHMAGLYSSWAAGPAILDPGRGCTVSWAGEQGRPSWILGEGVQSAGLGNRAGLGNGLGNRLGRTSWAGE